MRSAMRRPAGPGRAPTGGGIGYARRPAPAGVRARLRVDEVEAAQRAIRHGDRDGSERRVDARSLDGHGLAPPVAGSTGRWRRRPATVARPRPAPRARAPARRRRPGAGRGPRPGTRRSRRTRAWPGSARSTARCRACGTGARPARPGCRPARAGTDRPRPRRRPSAATPRAPAVRPMPSRSQAATAAGSGNRRVSPPSSTRLAAALDQAARQGGRGGHADLLAEDGAHQGLEAVPRARHAQARVGGQRRREQPAGRQAGRDGQRIRVEIEQPPDPAHQVEQPGRQPGGAAHAQLQRALAGRRDLEGGGAAGRQREGAAIPSGLDIDLLDTRDRAHGQERQQRPPRQRRAEGQAQPHLAARRRIAQVAHSARRAPASQLGRRAAEHRADHVVELAHAAEAAGQRHLDHRQLGGVEQRAGEVGPPRGCHRARRGAQVAREQPAQVALAHAELGGQGAAVAGVERAVLDEPQRARHGGRRAVPGRRAGRRLRPAAPARAKAGRLGRGGAGEEAHVAAQRRAGRTDRPAVDAGGHHRGEEAAVEARVAAAHRLVAADPRPASGVRWYGTGALAAGGFRTRTP